MSLDQLKAFLARMQDDAALKSEVLAAATADDVAQIGLKLGFEFSGVMNCCAYRPKPLTA